MAQELDDDIVDIQAPSQDEDDDIVGVEAQQEAPGFLSRMLSSAQETVTPALETAQDFSTGAAQGLSMGSMDELGGMIGAGIETGLGAIGIGPAAVDAQLAEQGFQVPEESFLQKYRGYQQASEQAQKESAERSPWANVAGQIAGGMTGGAVLGSALGIGAGAGKLKSISDVARDSGKAKAAMELLTRGGKMYAQAAPAIGLEAALTSEQQLIGEDANPMGVAKDVAGGLAFGLPAVLGLNAVSEVAAPSISKTVGKYADKVKGAFASEDQPRLRQIAKSFTEYGQDMGIHPRSHAQDISAGPESFALRDQKAVGTVMGQLEKADNAIGQQVGESLQKAEQRGALIDVSPDIQAAADRVAKIAELIPDLGSTRRSGAAYEKMLTGAPQLSPLELKTLIDDIDSSIGVFKAATNKTPQDTSTLSELMKFRSSISDTLKKGVPEYRLAAERFENFRNVLEQLISGDKPVEVTNKFYGKIRDPESKVFDSIDSIVKNVQRDDAASQPSRTAFVNFMNSMSEFQQKEAARMAQDPTVQKVIPDVQEMRKFILNASDDSVLRGSVKATTQGRSLVPDVKEWVIGKAPTSAAYYAGRISKKLAPKITSAADMSRKVFKAPDTYLNNLSSKLESTPGLGPMGKALRESIEKGDAFKKNAALFTIMQNPNAKLFIEADDLQDEEE